MLLHIIQDSALVRNNFSKAPIKVGDYILSINGIPVKKIINDFLPYISGELRHFRTSLIERDFPPDKPYRFFGGMQAKISKYTVTIVGKYLPAKKLRINSIYTYKDTAEAPPKNPLRFKGKIFVLTSPYTFSTASDFAAVIKDYKVGNLIGEETGGIPTHYGDSWPVDLPNSHLPLNVSWKYFIRPNGDTTYVHKGLMPDIPVKITAEDIRKGIDPVMEKIKEIINKDVTKGE